MSDRIAEIREREEIVVSEGNRELRARIINNDLPWLLTRLEQAEKLIQEALSETVDASVYSDGPNMSRELRADMRCFLGGE